MYNINQDQDITSPQPHLIHNLQNTTDTFYDVSNNLFDVRYDHMNYLTINFLYLFRVIVVTCIQRMLTLTSCLTVNRWQYLLHFLCVYIFELVTGDNWRANISESRTTFISIPTNSVRAAYY